MADFNDQLFNQDEFGNQYTGGSGGNASGSSHATASFGRLRFVSASAYGSGHVQADLIKLVLPAPRRPRFKVAPWSRPF